MNSNEKFSRLHFFEKLSSHVANASGSNPAIVIAAAIVLIWLLAGPFFNYSEHWQWMIHTVTTIITFLMVFLIQKSQNKDALAIQLKLNELVAANELASNRLVDIENMSEHELKIIQKYYSKLSDFTRKEENLQQSHSIDESEADHDIKKDMEKELIAKLK
ncbi:MAG: low affinity iron permease family protein [Chitinophagales bacterium]|nr:low affinity iron permease family protein [Chitinophagales bacterium]